MRTVIVAFENGANSQRIKEALESAGCARCLVCRSAAEVKRAARELRLRLVVCGFKLPDQSCEALYHDLPEGCDMLMVGPRARLDLCEAEGIAKLPTPLNRGELLSTVDRLGRRGPPRTEEERRLIDAAKAALQEQLGLTEEEAHRRLQKLSMDQGLKLPETARRLLDKKS